VSIASYRKAYSGPLVVMGTGSSLQKHDATRISCPVMTTNIAWQRRWMPDFHVCVETDQYKTAPAIYKDLHDAGKLFVLGETWPVGHKLGIRQDGELFSHDLEQGVVVSMDGFGSVLYVALQLAEYMGFGPIYVMGLDLGGPRFDGSKASDNIEKQNKLFLHAAAVMTTQVFNVGSPDSRCTAFPLADFSVVPREVKVRVPTAPDMVAPQ
jgi:hypothetical protein